MNALAYVDLVDIDLGIHKGKKSVKLHEMKNEKSVFSDCDVAYFGETFCPAQTSYF